MRHSFASTSTTAAILLLVMMMLFITSSADELTHMYEDGASVKVYANKIGPYNNPLETYAYFERPGCKPASDEHKFPSLGQALVGDEHFEMGMKITFAKSMTAPAELCTFTPTVSDAREWQSMVEAQYWYQLLVDDLPMWGVFGNRSAEKQAAASTADAVQVHQIYTLQNISLGYNGNRIVSANLTVHDPIIPTIGSPMRFRYIVTFVPRPDVLFEQRFDRYLDDDFFEHRIHWFSIFNSFMIVMFLVGMVGAILSRTLRADLAKLNNNNDVAKGQAGGGEDWGVDDSGWKQLHADVFRVPVQPALLCALVGTGVQLAILATLLMLVAIVSTVHTAPSGSLLSYGVFSYALTSFIAGYISSSQFCQFTLVGINLAPQWMRCMFYTATLFPATVLVGGFFLNFIAIAYDSAQAIPFGGMVAMLALWGLVACPLVVIGTVVGRHGGNRRWSSSSASSGGATSSNALPKVNQIPRIIPARPWYRSGLAFIIAGGILPFGTIFIELYMVFTSFWSYKWYYVYGFMLLVFVMLIVVTACVSILCTYFLISAEDHRWQWTSFLLGASTAGYVFLYAVYFYTFKTKMSGFLMWSFYFSYMGLLCYGVAILCGTVAYHAAAAFIRRIYRNVKAD